jgi:hypothetical protein
MEKILSTKEYRKYDIEAEAKKELNQILSEIGCGMHGKVTLDGIYVRDALRKLGWVEKSYFKYVKATSSQQIFSSSFHYFCGYSGNYQKSNLVKVCIVNM